MCFYITFNKVNYIKRDKIKVYQILTFYILSSMLLVYTYKQWLNIPLQEVLDAWTPLIKSSVLGCIINVIFAWSWQKMDGVNFIDLIKEWFLIYFKQQHSLDYSSPKSTSICYMLKHDFYLLLADTVSHI